MLADRSIAVSIRFPALEDASRAPIIAKLCTFARVTNQDLAWLNLSNNPRLMRTAQSVAVQAWLPTCRFSMRCMINRVTTHASLRFSSPLARLASLTASFVHAMITKFTITT